MRPHTNSSPRHRKPLSPVRSQAVAESAAAPTVWAWKAAALASGCTYEHVASVRVRLELLLAMADEMEGV